MRFIYVLVGIFYVHTFMDVEVMCLMNARTGLGVSTSPGVQLYKRTQHKTIRHDHLFAIIIHRGKSLT